MTDNSKYLGIDYGSKRVGIAVSDENKKIAFPRSYILNNSYLFHNILAVIRNENISKIIIGYPLNLKSEKTTVTEQAEKFKKTLESLFKKESLDIGIIFLDERFTSSIAQRNVISSITKKSRRKEKGLIDSLSAQIILQDYLDKINC